MNKRIQDLFKGVAVKVVEEGIYQDTGNKYRSITINGKKISTRFNAFVDARCKGGYTDFKRDKLVLASDDFMKNGTIQVYGNTFQIEERISKAGDKYLAILKDGKKVGYFVNSKQRACFNNVCI